MTKKIIQQLQPHLPGFKPHEKTSLARPIAGGTQFIGVALVDYRTLFRFTLTISTRIEQVQEIMNRFSGSPPKFHHITLTTATMLAYFSGASEHERFEVRSPEDVAAAVAELAPVLRDRVLPFLDAHQTVQSLDAVMNGPEGRRFDRTNAPYRQMTGLTLARLAGNPRFDALVESARAEMRGLKPHGAAKLEALVAYLRTTGGAP
ncbi:MAG TPA: hypothetical protein VN903_00200 [Polyangia bacterium]|nr:hypothetical protein [Polyangia bacterium]